MLLTRPENAQRLTCSNAADDADALQAEAKAAKAEEQERLKRLHDAQLAQKNIVICWWGICLIFLHYPSHSWQHRLIKSLKYRNYYLKNVYYGATSGANFIRITLRTWSCATR